jgi:hypothetical protein
MFQKVCNAIGTGPIPAAGTAKLIVAVMQDDGTYYSAHVELPIDEWRSLPAGELLERYLRPATMGLQWESRDRA